LNKYHTHVSEEPSLSRKSVAKKVRARKTSAKKAGKKASAKRAAGVKKKAAGRVERPYPRRPLEEAARVPIALKEQYGGNARPPADVATALGYAGPTSNAFFYQTAASRDFGLTSGFR
jgi:hypothetical protein